MSAEGGYSLLEILVAIAILGVFLIPLTTVFSQSLRYVRGMKKRDKATRLMTSCLSQLRSVADYSSDLSTGSPVKCDGNGWGGGTYETFPSPDDDFEYRTSVELVAEDSGRNIKKVSIRVRYSSPLLKETRCLSSVNCNDWDASTFVSQR